MLKPDVPDKTCLHSFCASKGCSRLAIPPPNPHPVGWCQRILIGDWSLHYTLLNYTSSSVCCGIGDHMINAGFPTAGQEVDRHLSPPHGIVSEEAQCGFRAVTVAHWTMKTEGDPQHHSWTIIIRNSLRGIYRSQWKTWTSAFTQ